jgi:hypothetical protein
MRPGSYGLLAISTDDCAVGKPRTVRCGARRRVAGVVVRPRVSAGAGRRWSLGGRRRVPACAGRRSHGIVGGAACVDMCGQTLFLGKLGGGCVGMCGQTWSRGGWSTPCVGMCGQTWSLGGRSAPHVGMCGQTCVWGGRPGGPASRRPTATQPPEAGSHRRPPTAVTRHRKRHSRPPPRGRAAASDELGVRLSGGAWARSRGCGHPCRSASAGRSSGPCPAPAPTTGPASPGSGRWRRAR